MRCRLAGKPAWHKLKNSGLQSARRAARDILRSGLKVQRKQAARMVEDFSKEELDRCSNAAEKTRKKVEGYHAKVLDHWPGGAGLPIASADKRDVEKFIKDAVGTCGASYSSQFVQ